MENIPWNQIFISVAFISGTGLALSLMLILAEKKILNYGICKIDINAGKKQLEVKGGDSLLSSLSENSIFIPSACGGRGSCGYCKLKVISGAGTLGPVELPFLSEREISDSIRLSCQVKVRRDMEISIPEELFSVRRFSAVLESKRALTHDIVELKIRVREPAAIDFTAGQYIQLTSDEYKGRDRVNRAYSISSKPSDRDFIQLVTRRVPEGIATTWIFDYLDENDKIEFSGPYGEFRLSDTDAPVIFIAGGSGMAPIMSMLQDMREKGSERKAVYFFGAVSQPDLFYLDELKDMERQLKHFTFVPALSGEPEGSDWKGERGLITDVVKKIMGDMTGHEAYLCGSPGMIDACVKVLTEGGVPEDKIYYDKF